MKALHSIVLLPAIGALVRALTDQDCSDQCEAGAAGALKAKIAPFCPEADMKKVTAGGVEYTLYCKKAIAGGSILEQGEAADINVCTGRCTRNPKCESVNFWWSETPKRCLLLDKREDPPSYDSAANGYNLMAAVPTVAASDRFQVTDTCPDANGKIKKIGTVDWKITCGTYHGDPAPMQPVQKFDSMLACAQACQNTKGCLMADYYISSQNKGECHMRNQWKATPGMTSGDLAALTPVVNPAIANAPELQATEQCPAIDKQYRKLGGKTFKMWCYLAVKGGTTIKSSQQPSREACIKSCIDLPGIMSINYSTGGDNPQLCQCKSTKEDVPSYNLDAKSWWSATLA